MTFQILAAVNTVRELHRLAEDTAGHPLTLSANTCMPLPEHLAVTPSLNYLVGEVRQYASDALNRSGHAVTAYALATALNRPIAATAHGEDWEFAKRHPSESLVRYWIAQAYACGQRLMAPERAWCFSPTRGMDWYASTC